MAKWEIDPYKSAGDNTVETQLEQIEQELESQAKKVQFLLEEKKRLEAERANT